MLTNAGKYDEFAETNPDFIKNMFSEGLIEEKNEHWLWKGSQDIRGGAQLRFRSDDGKRHSFQVAQIILRFHYPDHKYTSNTIPKRIGDCSIRHCIRPEHIKPRR